MMLSLRRLSSVSRRAGRRFRGLLAAFLLPAVLVGAQAATAASSDDDPAAPPPREAYLRYVEEAAEAGWDAYPGIIERWRENVDPSELWGYNSPGQPLYLADILSFLYEVNGDETAAERAAQILVEYGDLRDAYPADYADTRAEYDDGIPALVNFFHVTPYTRAYTRIGHLLDTDEREIVEQNIAESVDFIFHFPEWGAHNRAIVRAEGLAYGVMAIPDHPRADDWRKMARIIASDNLTQWEVEDATHYNPIWLSSLFSYAQISGEEELVDSPIMRYYADFYKQLFTPAATIADVGDADWDPGTSYYIASFERLASAHRDGEAKWVADQLFDALEASESRGVTAASQLMLAYQWADDGVQPVRPSAGTQEVLEDIVGKKVVFRDGWDPQSTYLLLNYRDEGSGGYNTREYLRHTISVEEEKMHHGHSDENSIALLMSGGSVLLHDSGYRSGLPSGPYGQYRSDYYHNRLVARKDKRDRHQSVPDFIRTSGAYRPVETQKIEFLTLQDVDFSRTRMTDNEIGYSWDRLLAWVRPLDVFIVIDAVEVLVEDYYTFTNLWHTQTIHERGEGYYDTSLDSIGSYDVSDDRRLLISFLETYAKEDGTYEESRHFQPETAIYQTQASHYRAGDFEVFVTALIPHDAGENPADLVDGIELLPVDTFPEAAGLRITHGDGAVSYLGAKLDLDSEVVRENIRPRYTWEAGRTTYGDFETDAHFFFATVDADSIRYSASQVLQVRYRDRTLMEALPNTHGLQLDGAPDRVGYVKWRYWEDVVSAE